MRTKSHGPSSDGIRLNCGSRLIHLPGRPRLAPFPSSAWRRPALESWSLESRPLHAGRIPRPLHARLLQTSLLQTGTLRRILPLQAGLTRGIVARIIPVRIGPPQRALPRDDLAANILRRVDLSHDALVAQRLLR